MYTFNVFTGSQTALGVLVPDALVSEGEVTPSKCNGQLARDVHISDHERYISDPFQSIVSVFLYYTYTTTTAILLYYRYNYIGLLLLLF